MFLKSLTISGLNGVIREIRFHSGLNLIVDETPGLVGKEAGKETGNNVGKTTVLMLIDFCLGSSGRDIYTDPENRKEEYSLVKNFLTENEVLITLVLSDNLLDPIARELRIERNFLPRKKMIRRVNGEALTEEAFDEALLHAIIPGHGGKKPSFRQIISHNIRYKDGNINNTLKTLDKFTSDVEYETLYLFLLGCDFRDGDQRQALLADIKIEQAFKDRLEKEQTRSVYETALSILENEIIELDRRKANFNLNENFEADLAALNQVRYQLNVLSGEIGKLNIRRQLIVEARQELEANVSTIDLQQLNQIYQQATQYVAGIQKTFEQLYAFHNQMILEKARYIGKDLPRIDDELTGKNAQLKRLLQQEADLAAALTHGESFAALEILLAEINEKYRRKGECENMIRQLNDSDTALAELAVRLGKIDVDLFSDEFEDKINTQKDKFNRFFATISQRLYDEQYALTFDRETKKGKKLYKFSAFNTNFSSGKKQGEISCFDIAYTLFADQEGIPCLHFLLNDKKELMHDNQLVRIANLVAENNIQFVASILKDKLPAALNDEAYFVLKMSHKDKLFRIE
jgi:uncharacterized protein YydD (DUF2326 family)